MRRFILTGLVALYLTAPLQAKNMYIPAAGKAPGANGTYWRTDVRIFNPSRVKEISVRVWFLPQGVDGRNIPGRTFQIGKLETLVLDDIVAAVAPGLTGIGAIRIDSDHAHSNDEFIATSRTYTNSADPARRGTYGQFVPALEETEARRSTAVLQVAVRPDVRTNVGVMNPANENVTLQIRVLGTDGTVYLHSPSLEVPAKSMQQWSLSDLFGGIYAADATVIIGASAPLFTWGAVIDNDSGDSIFVRGIDADHQ